MTTLTNVQYTNRVLSLLNGFVRQRPGITADNYGCAKSYYADRRRVARDLKDFGALESAVLSRLAEHPDTEVFGPEEWRYAFTSYSGRLVLEKDADGNPTRLSYYTGQYFPTEYRKAACAVLATLLWEYERRRLPAPVCFMVSYFNEATHTSVSTLFDTKDEGAAWLAKNPSASNGSITARYDRRGTLDARAYMFKRLRPELGNKRMFRYF